MLCLDRKPGVYALSRLMVVGWVTMSQGDPVDEPSPGLDAIWRDTGRTEGLWDRRGVYKLLIIKGYTFFFFPATPVNLLTPCRPPGSQHPIRALEFSREIEAR